MHIVEDLQDAACKHAANALRDPIVIAADALPILAEEVFMVHIALHTVKEQALDTGNGSLGVFPQEAGPVCRDLFAANGVGMVAEIDQDHGVTFPVESQHIHSFIGFAGMTDDLRVIGIRIGLYLAAFGQIPTDIGNIMGMGNRIAHLCRLQILQRQHNTIHHTGEKLIAVKLLQLRCRHFVDKGAGVDMRIMDVHRLDRDAGGLRHRFPEQLRSILIDTDVVHRHHCHLGIAAGKAKTVCFQLIQNTLHKTLAVRTGDADPQGRGNIHTRKTNLQCIHNQFLLKTSERDIKAFLSGLFCPLR